MLTAASGVGKNVYSLLAAIAALYLHREKTSWPQSEYPAW